MIIGLGFVGLTLAVFLARKRLEVHGIDKEESIVNKISRREAPFFEEGFDLNLKLALESSLSIGNNNSIGSQMKFSNLFITVDSLLGEGPDPGYLNNTIDLILKHLNGAKSF